MPKNKKKCKKLLNNSKIKFMVNCVFILIFIKILFYSESWQYLLTLLLKAKSSPNKINLIFISWINFKFLKKSRKLFFMGFL